MRGFVRARTLKSGKKTYDVVLDTGIVLDATGAPRRGRKWKTFAKKGDAEDYLAAAIGKVRSGTYVEPTKQTLAEYMADWLAARSPGLKASTAASYRTIVNRYIIPALGQVKAAQLSPDQIGRFYSDLASRLSPRTVRYVATILKAALAAGIRDGKLGRNPAQYVAPPRLEAARERRTWTAAQLRDFLAGAQDDELYAAYHLAATTGLRRGEICGLRWRDIDFEAGRLTVEVNRVLVGGRPHNTTPKRGRGRSISLDSGTLEVLRQHRVRQLKQLAALAQDETAPADVFLNWDGAPLSPDTLSYRFEQAVKASGLPPLSLHGLRHTWATLALKAGVHPKIVQERLGHSSIAVTMNVYSHVLAEIDSRAAETVAGLFTPQREISHTHG